jgi:hypothetical protein
MTAYLPGEGTSDVKAIWRAILSLASGRSNATGTVLLTPSAGSTTTIDNNVAGGSAIQLTPMTANAAAALSTTYVSATANGSFTLAHASNSQNDRQFTYAIIG